MTILIVGATGTLGRPVARALLEAGHSVRALVRDRKQADDLRALGAELVLGDLTDPRSLELACKGMERVFAAAHSMLGRGETSSAQVDLVGHSALVVAAKAAKVEHFVYTSALGARDSHPIDFFRTKREIETVVKGSGMGWTILRPSAFMEQHVHLFNGKMLLDNGFVVLLGRANKPRNFVAVRDVVPFVVQALAADDLAGRTIEIGGPDNFSNTEVAQLYIERVRKGRIVHVPAGLARAIAGAIRPLHEGVARVIDVSLTSEREVREEWYPNKLLDEFPRLLTGVEAFIDERVAEWKRERARR